MGKIITVFSHKGGVGKTTLVHNIGFLAANRGKKILLIDADSQMNLTSAIAGMSTGTSYSETSSAWCQFLAGNTNFALFLKSVTTGSLVTNFYQKPAIYRYNRAHRKTQYRNTIQAGDCEFFANGGQLHLIPSSIGYNSNDLSGGAALSTLPKIEFQLANLVSNPEGFSSNIIYQLHSAISSLKERYDYILIDTAPNASSILNGLLLFSSDYFIVPTKPDFFSLQAIDNLSDVFLNWSSLFKPWFTTPNHIGLKFPRFVGVVPQMTKRFSDDIEDDDVGYAEHSQEWITHINTSILRFLQSYREKYEHYKIGQTIDHETSWFKSIFPESEPFIIQECVHFTGKLRTVAEHAGVPVAFLNNAIGKEHHFDIAAFDNTDNSSTNQYAMAFRTITSEYNYIVDGLITL